MQISKHVPSRHRLSVFNTLIRERSPSGSWLEPRKFKESGEILPKLNSLNQRESGKGFMRIQRKIYLAVLGKRTGSHPVPSPRGGVFENRRELDSGILLYGRSLFTGAESLDLFGLSESCKTRSKYWSTEIRKLGFENYVHICFWNWLKISKYRICDFIKLKFDRRRNRAGGRERGVSSFVFVVVAKIEI